MTNYASGAFVIDEQSSKPHGPRLRDPKEGGHTVVTAFTDNASIAKAMLGKNPEWAAYSGGSGSDGVHSFYREDICWQFKDKEQYLPQAALLASANGVPLPKAVIDRIVARRKIEDVKNPITKEEMIEALNDPRTMTHMGHPYFTEHHHISEIVSGAAAQKGATIGLQVNGRNETVTGPRRVSPGDLLEAEWLSDSDLRNANKETNRADDRASLRAVPYDPKRPQTMAHVALKDVLTRTPATEKAMKLDPWADGSDAAGYAIGDGNFVGATLARQALLNMILGMNYLMKQKIITVNIEPAEVGNLPDGVADDHLKIAAFLAQLTGALPADAAQSDYMLHNVPEPLIKSIFRETVLSMMMPESLKVDTLLFGANRDGADNELLTESKRLKNASSTAAQLFKYQHDGLNRQIAAFTQLVNGHNERLMGVALRGEAANSIVAYLR